MLVVSDILLDLGLNSALPCCRAADLGRWTRRRGLPDGAPDGKAPTAQAPPLRDDGVTRKRLPACQQSAHSRDGSLKACSPGRRLAGAGGNGGGRHACVGDIQAHTPLQARPLQACTGALWSLLGPPAGASQMDGVKAAAALMRRQVSVTAGTTWRITAHMVKTRSEATEQAQVRPPPLACVPLLTVNILQPSRTVLLLACYASTGLLLSPALPRKCHLSVHFCYSLFVHTPLATCARDP
jgi:hypothetical protein